MGVSSLEGKLDLVLDLMFPRGSCCLSGQTARPLLSRQLSQRPAQGMVCVHSHREPQSGVAGTHACYPPFTALVACAQTGQKASWVLGGGGHVPGGPITSRLAQADLTPHLTTGHRGFLHCPPAAQPALSPLLSGAGSQRQI